MTSTFKVNFEFNHQTYLAKYLNTFLARWQARKDQYHAVRLIVDTKL
jgi:hypothetical protein